MTTATTQREPELLGQTVVVIGGSAGIGLETARRARAEGADIILTGRNPDRLQRAADELGALSSAAFDATDPAALDRFFGDLPEAIDHVLVTGPGPYYARLADLDRERAHRDFDDHLWLAVAVAQHAIGRVRPGGTLLFMGGTGGRGRGPGLSLIAAATAALPALIANLAVEVAPIRVNLIAAGFVDTPLSASLLGDELDKRRDQLRATLPIGRVVGPADVAALAGPSSARGQLGPDAPAAQGAGDPAPDPGRRPRAVRRARLRGHHHRGDRRPGRRRRPHRVPRVRHQTRPAGRTARHRCRRRRGARGGAGAALGRRASPRPRPPEPAPPLGPRGPPHRRPRGAA